MDLQDIVLNDINQVKKKTDTKWFHSNVEYRKIKIK